MAQALSVNGECQIMVGTASAGTANENLCISVPRGTRVRPNVHRKPVYVDTTGPEVPFDHLYMGEDGHVVVQTPFYDDAVLSKVRAAKIDVLPGVEIDIGTILGGLAVASAGYHRLTILSPTAAKPWDFATAFLVGEPTEVLLSTQETVWQLTWYYFVKGVPGSQAGKVVYDHVYP